MDNISREEERSRSPPKSGKQYKHNKFSNMFKSSNTGSDSSSDEFNMNLPQIDEDDEILEEEENIASEERHMAGNRSGYATPRLNETGGSSPRTKEESDFVEDSNANNELYDDVDTVRKYTQDHLME